MKKILALDWGKARVGVALAVGGVIETLPVVEGGNPWRKIKEISASLRPHTVVLGYSPGKKRAAQKVAFRLQKMLKLPVRLMDETLTTQEAKRLARRLGKRRGRVDSLAAALILEYFLLKEGG